MTFTLLDGIAWNKLMAKMEFRPGWKMDVSYCIIWHNKVHHNNKGRVLERLSTHKRHHIYIYIIIELLSVYKLRKCYIKMMQYPCHSSPSLIRSYIHLKIWQMNVQSCCKEWMHLAISKQHDFKTSISCILSHAGFMELIPYALWITSRFQRDTSKHWGYWDLKDLSDSDMFHGVV